MIDWKRQCAAVIPCHNEAGRIGAVVECVRRYLPTVLVVDDGSRDATPFEGKAAGAMVVHRPAKGGKGTALRAGWQEARKLGFEWVLSLDGDGQHDAADAPQFFSCAEKTGAKLVIGNRMDHCEEMPLVRRWANVWMSRCLSNMTGVALPDSQCGFRLIHLEMLLALPLAAKGFVIESETLAAFIEAGERVEFVPIRVIYGPGRSKICPVRDTWRWLRWKAAVSG